MNPQEEGDKPLDRDRLLTVLTQERDFHVTHSGAVTQKVLFSTVTYLATAAGVVVGFKRTVPPNEAWLVCIATAVGVALVMWGLAIHEKKHHGQVRVLAKLIAKVWLAKSLEDALPEEGDLADAMDRQPPGKHDTMCFCLGVAAIVVATLVGVFNLVAAS